MKEVYSLWSMVYGLCLLSVLGGSLSGCQSARPAPGEAVYHRTTYTEAGRIESRTAITVRQNEDPAGPTRIHFQTFPPSHLSTLEVSFSDSFIRKIPKSFAHMETILLIAGILCLLAAAALGGIGRHWKLMTIAGLTGLALIALAVTIDRYAWAYGLALVASAAAFGWYLWRRYKKQLLNEPPF